MRFLNKVIFINSSTIRYAEIMLDGNVHLIGTQGVGKSTLLRAILFFYNADTLKLGIPREKKTFAEYYFPYQNSFLIYEVMRETGPFCIAAFKSQGKVCFRFLDSAYDREHFVSPEGHAFEKWEDNRQILDLKGIDYSRKIDRYEEYRDILYGNNDTGKKEFAKYALLQSRQYQNIPRTIQNVFLNSKLEAEFIKQTIIMSLNEEDITIDLQSYTHHLKNFEQQLNDISQYKQPHVARQAENIVKNHMAIRHLENEKNTFALQLAWTVAHIQRNIPNLQHKLEKSHTEKEALIEKAATAEQRFANKSDKIKGEISVLDNDLKKAKEKIDHYNRMQIDQIIARVDKKKDHETEQQKLSKEKELLTTRFSEVTLKYDSLLQALELSSRRFEQDKREEHATKRGQAAQEKEDARNWLENAYGEIRLHSQKDILQARHSVEHQQSILQEQRMKKASVTHQRFFEAEMESAKNTTTQYWLAIQQTGVDREHLKNRIETLQKQWELDEALAKQNTGKQVEQLQANIARQQIESAAITGKLQKNEAAFYGWLNENKPGWENTIGKIIREDILFNTELSPGLHKDESSLFGVEIAVKELPITVKTLSQYQEELKHLENSIGEQRQQLQDLQAQQAQQQEKLKKKYQPQIKEAKDNLLEKQYKQEQDTQQHQQALLLQKDWEIKANSARQELLHELDTAIAAAAEAVLKAQNTLQHAEEEINRLLKTKEREYNRKLAAIEQNLEQQTFQLNEAVKAQKEKGQEEQQQILKEQQKELSGKGADTSRLATLDENLQKTRNELQFIEDNRDLVAEYNKDKKDLIDKVFSFKEQKAALEDQYRLEANKYTLQKEKFANVIKETEEGLNRWEQELNRLENNLKAFDVFRQTEVYHNLPAAYTGENERYKNDKDAHTLIQEINRCFYTAIGRLDDLKEATHKFLGNFSVQNIFNFPESLTDKLSYQQFAEDLNEFIQNSKIEEYEKRVNERFANVIKLVGKETADLMSRAGDIQKIIGNINKDFDNKNFVGAIRKIELRIDDSSNKVVQLLLQVKQFNDEFSFDIGSLNLFSSVDQASKNKKAVDLLKQLSKSITEHRKDSIALSDSFELKFRVEENLNDTGWVEKLSNVGSEGTDVLVKAMINIMLLNVFKEGASKRFKDFRLHCMMDEIGKLHPNNIKGILQFANDRNILLINGSPTETNALNYRHIYKLEKDNNRNTRIKRIITTLTPA